MSSALSRVARTPPVANSRIVEIMGERHVTKGRAYRILRSEVMGRLDHRLVEPDDPQRVAVLTAIVDVFGTVSTTSATDILDALHRSGYSIDMHDVVKSLWSLQKGGLVKFYERTNPSTLYAIRLTDAGISAYDDLRGGRRQEALDLLVAHDKAFVDEGEDEAESTASDELIPPVDDDDTWLTKLPMATKAPVTTTDLSEWPAVAALVERVRRARKINAAARLLEEVGEDETALALMANTELSPL